VPPPRTIAAQKQCAQQNGYTLGVTLGSAGLLGTFKTQALVTRLYHPPTQNIFQGTPLHHHPAPGAHPAAGAQPTARKGQPKYPLLLKQKNQSKPKKVSVVIVR